MGFVKALLGLVLLTIKRLGISVCQGRSHEVVQSILDRRGISKSKERTRGLSRSLPTGQLIVAKIKQME